MSDSAYLCRKWEQSKENRSYKCGQWMSKILTFCLKISDHKQFHYLLLLYHTSYYWTPCRMYKNTNIYIIYTKSWYISIHLKEKSTSTLPGRLIHFFHSHTFYFFFSPVHWAFTTTTTKVIDTKKKIKSKQNHIRFSNRITVTPR